MSTTPIDPTAVNLELSSENAAAITTSGQQLVLHAAQGLDIIKLTSEFLDLRNTYLHDIDAVRYAALTFTAMAAQPFADAYVCTCDGPECTGITVAFAHGEDLGSLQMLGTDDVPEPLRTFGRVITAHIGQDMPMLGALVSSVPEDGMQQFVQTAFSMAVNAARQQLGSHQ